MKSPSCKYYRRISNNQLKKGNFYCELKKENMNINQCKDCPHLNEIMKEVFKESLSQFFELFNVIEYVDPSVDYDKFCKINKDNEKRKALGAFFINLSLNGIIPNITIINITRTLLFQIYSFISQENKKNEVDELSENIALFYKKEFYNDDNDDDAEYELINGFTISEIIKNIAHSKVKDYKSLTNKSLFKFMDMIDM